MRISIMSQIKAYTPEKLVIGILVSDLSLMDELKKCLSEHWGEIDLWTEAEEFTWTDYYHKEMGKPLYRVFCSFIPLIDPENLASIKVKSNEIEDLFRTDEGRRINLDPGILCQSKFLLASTKNNAHRIPMGRGIYGELTLQYRQGAFRELDWTYPDYRGERARNFLMDVRKIYVSQLNTLKEQR